MAASLKIPDPKQPNILQPGETENQLVQGFLKEGQDAQARVAPITQKIGQIGEEISQIKPPEAPNLQQVPQFQGRQVGSDEMMNFAGIAMGLAAIGSRLVKGDATLMLAAAGSAIDGFQKGTIAQAKLDVEQFNTKLNAVVASNNEQLAAYDRVMKDRTLSLNQKVQQLAVLSHQYQDEIGITALKQNDVKFLLDRADKLRSANNQLEMKKLQMNQMFEFRKFQAEMMAQRASNQGAGPAGGLGALTPEAVDMLAHQASKDRSVLVGLGRGVQGAKDLRAITNRMAELAAAEGGPGMAQRRAEFRADSNSLNKLTSSYDALTAFEQTAVRNGRSLVDLADKIDITGIPVIERWIRSGRQSVAGDPDVSQFNAQMQVYRTEAARILTNPNLTGQLTDSARHEVETFLSGSDSTQQITAVVSLLERDFGNRKITLEKQMDAIRDRMTKGYGAGDKPQAPAANDLTYKGFKFPNKEKLDAYKAAGG